VWRKLLPDEQQNSNSEGNAERSDELTNSYCHVFISFDVGWFIDLNRCEELIKDLTERAQFKKLRRTPAYFDYQPAPLRVRQQIEPFFVEYCRSSPEVDVTLFDFGAISVSYTFPLKDSFGRLVKLSDTLYDNEVLLRDARQRVEEIFQTVQSAIRRARISELSEYYIVYNIGGIEGVSDLRQFTLDNSEVTAQILRSESELLSSDEVTDALSLRMSYSPQENFIIDWNAALLFGKADEDVLSVLEFANVELLEMRFVDSQLDELLVQAYEAMKGGSNFSSNLRRIGELQVDIVLLFEGVNKSLKLLGDQYIARLYSLVAQRFHLKEWDSGIIRKLQTVDSVYEKISDRAAQWRMEVLEWIIIALIAISIIPTFVKL